MKFFITLVLFTLFITPAMAKESTEDKQMRLDASCEVARQKKLLPMRKQFVDECVVNKEFSSRAECERFYADYGNRMGGRAPLFYDLPECEEAFEYRQSVRSRD